MQYTNATGQPEFHWNKLLDASHGDGKLEFELTCLANYCAIRAVQELLRENHSKYIPRIHIHETPGL